MTNQQRHFPIGGKEGIFDAACRQQCDAALCPGQRQVLRSLGLVGARLVHSLFRAHSRLATARSNPSSLFENGQRCLRKVGLAGHSEREGFEPSVGFPTHALQACALDHSATFPCSASPRQKTVGFALPGRPFDARSELCQLAPRPLQPKDDQPSCQPETDRPWVETGSHLSAISGIIIPSVDLP